MNVLFRASFQRDVKKISDAKLLNRIRVAIESVERADSPSEIRDLKKLAGHGDFYRIRIGDYRLGLVIDGETCEFVRCLSRRDLYRYFP